MPGDIFHSEVDINLQDELRHRGAAGFNRSPKDLQFMLEKVANVSLGAYDGTKRDVTKLMPESFIGPIIQSTDVDTGNSIGFPKSSFLPGGKNGYLNENATIREQNTIDNIDVSGYQIVKKDDGSVSVEGY